MRSIEREMKIYLIKQRLQNRPRKGTSLRATYIFTELHQLFDFLPEDYLPNSFEVLQENRLAAFIHLQDYLKRRLTSGIRVDEKAEMSEDVADVFMNRIVNCAGPINS